MYPHAGGNYVYLREAYHPAAGFQIGWLSFLVIYTIVPRSPGTTMCFSKPNVRQSLSAAAASSCRIVGITVDLVFFVFSVMIASSFLLGATFSRRRSD